MGDVFINGQRLVLSCFTRVLKNMLNLIHCELEHKFGEITMAYINAYSGNNYLM
jgi:hypothetical protein